MHAVDINIIHGVCRSQIEDNQVGFYYVNGETIAGKFQDIAWKESIASIESLRGFRHGGFTF